MGHFRLPKNVFFPLFSPLKNNKIKAADYYWTLIIYP